MLKIKKEKLNRDRKKEDHFCLDNYNILKVWYMVYSTHSDELGSSNLIPYLNLMKDSRFVVALNSRITAGCIFATCLQ